MRMSSREHFFNAGLALVLAAGLAGCGNSAPASQPAAGPAEGSAEAASLADVHRFSIGRFEAAVLKDGDLEFANDGKTIGIGRSPDEVGALLRAAGEPVDTLRLSIQALLVHAGDRVVLFDTGAGEMESADTGRLPQALAAAGVEPGQVTDILISHGHGDHIGGLLDARGNPRFANATVRMSAAEWQAIQADARRAPLVEALAGRIETFAPGAQVLPGVTSVPVAGHTPGHSAYQISSDGGRLLYIGDAAHHYVVSVQRPQWTIAFDGDAPAAAASREELLARAAEEALLVQSPHFPFPGLGRFERRSDGFIWVPLD